MDSELRQRLKERDAAASRARRNSSEQTGIDIERDIDYVVAAMTSSDAASEARTASSSPAAASMPPARGPGPRARRRGRGVQGQAPGQGVRRRPRAPPTRSRRGRPSRAPHHRSSLAFLEPGLVAIGSEDGHQERDRRAADRPQHHQQQRDDGARRRHRARQQRLGRRPLRRHRRARRSCPSEIRSQIPAVKTFAVMTHIDGGVTGTLRAEARDDESAENLRQVVQGFLALGRMQAQTTRRRRRCSSRCSSPAPARPSRSRSRCRPKCFDMIPIEGSEAAAIAARSCDRTTRAPSRQGSDRPPSAAGAAVTGPARARSVDDRADSGTRSALRRAARRSLSRIPACAFRALRRATRVLRFARAWLIWSSSTAR